MIFGGGVGSEGNEGKGYRVGTKKNAQNRKALGKDLEKNGKG